MDLGIKCPNPAPSDDWAILKLETEIKDIQPYGLPGEFDDPIRGTKLISVSAASHDFSRVDKNTGKTIYPKSIEDCAAGVINPRQGSFGAASFESNCDSDHGNSGGSVIRIIDGKPILVGVTSGMITHKNPNPTNAYDPSVWADTHVSLSGEFLEKLKLAIGR
jgi:hypothetical protein